MTNCVEACRQFSFLEKTKFLVNKKSLSKNIYRKNQYNNQTITNSMLKSKIKCYCFHIPKTYAQSNNLKCFFLLESFFLFSIKLSNLSSFSLTALLKHWASKSNFLNLLSQLSLLLQKNTHLQFFQRNHGVLQSFYFLANIINYVIEVVCKGLLDKTIFVVTSIS